MKRKISIQLIFGDGSKEQKVLEKKKKGENSYLGLRPAMKLEGSIQQLLA